MRREASSDACLDGVAAKLGADRGSRPGSPTGGAVDHADHLLNGRWIGWVEHSLVAGSTPRVERGASPGSGAVRQSRALQRRSLGSPSIAWLVVALLYQYREIHEEPESGLEPLTPCLQ